MTDEEFSKLTDDEIKEYVIQHQDTAIAKAWYSAMKRGTRHGINLGITEEYERQHGR